MTRRPSSVDLIVVGGGLGGLLAATLGQKQGKTVIVLERSAASGGLGRSPKLGELPFNLGPRALYLGGAAERVLKELGVALLGFAPSSSGWVEIDGSLEPLPNSPMALLRAQWLSIKERLSLVGALTKIVLRLPPLGMSLSAWLDTIPSARVRAVIAALVRVATYTNDPDTLSARLAFTQLRSVLAPWARGVRYLDGGWQSLVDALAPQVPMRLGARVTHVSAEGAVSLADGEVVYGREVALAVPLAEAAKLTHDERLNERTASARPVRAACLDVVLSALPVPQRRFVLGIDAPLYFSVHSRPGTRGGHKVHVAAYLRPDETTDAATLQKQLEAFLERVQPGWRPLCKEQRFFPHLRVMDDVPRETPTQLTGRLRFISSVASTQFLFDGVAESCTIALRSP